MADSNKYNSKLSGKRVLVVGGSSGIGFAAAEAIVENGAIVFISSSSQARIDNAIERIVAEYPSAKGRVAGFPCNLGDQATLEPNIVNLLDKVTKDGKLDHIIHTAGDGIPAVPLPDVTVAGTIQASMVRLYAPLIIGKHAGKYLTAGPYSSVTFTTGSIVSRPIKDWVVPNAIMAGVTGLVQGLALDLAPIRVNNVEPGAVETEMWSHVEKEAREAFLANVKKTSPTGRVAKAEDIAHAYVYLLKDPNVTGTLLKTNSGALLASAS